jgi:hypothetical protein
VHAVSYPFPQQRWRSALQQLPNRSGQRWGQQHACRSAVAAVVGEDDKPHCCRLSCSKRHSHPQGTQARFQGRAHLLLRVVPHTMQAQVGSSAGTLPLATSRPTHHTSVVPALLHKVSDSPPLQHFPLVHSSVHASRQQRGVVRRPPQAPDLQLTSVQISMPGESASSSVSYYDACAGSTAGLHRFQSAGQTACLLTARGKAVWFQRAAAQHGTAQLGRHAPWHWDLVLPYLAVVASQHCQGGACVGAVHVHCIAVGGCKVLATVAEAAVSGSFDGQLLDCT